MTMTPLQRDEVRALSEIDALEDSAANDKLRAEVDLLRHVIQLLDVLTVRLFVGRRRKDDEGES
jgi:hypothetical protein